MTFMTFEEKEYILDWLVYLQPWAMFFGLVFGVFDPAVGKAIVMLTISALVMFGLGIMNDVQCGVITEEEWETRRIM